MAAAAKNAIAVDALTVVAGAGYSNGKNTAAREREGITPCVLANRSTNNQGDGSDSYLCPAGRKLVRKQFMRRGYCILYPGEYCSGCALKPALHECRAAFADSTFSRGSVQADECRGLRPIQTSCASGGALRAINLISAALPYEDVIQPP